MKGRGLSPHLLYFWFAQNAPFSYHTCTGGETFLALRKGGCREEAKKHLESYAHSGKSAEQQKQYRAVELSEKLFRWRC